MNIIKEKLKIERQIGRGSFGSVHEGLYDGKKVAIKVEVIK